MTDDNGLNKRFILTLLNGLTVIIALIGVGYLMQRIPTAENQFWIAIISGGVGSLITIHVMSQQWWFGQSKGASDTAATLRDLANKGQQHDVPQQPTKGDPNVPPTV